MHFFRSSSSSFRSSSSSSTRCGGPPFSLAVERGSVFMLSVVGRWGLSPRGGTGGGGGLEVEADLVESGGGGRIGGDGRGRSGMSATGGRGGGGVRGGGSGLWRSSEELQPVSGRLLVLPVLPSSTMVDSWRRAAGLGLTASSGADGSEVTASGMAEELPAEGNKHVLSKTLLTTSLKVFQLPPYTWKVGICVEIPYACLFS